MAAAPHDRVADVLAEMATAERSRKCHATAAAAMELAASHTIDPQERARRRYAAAADARLAGQPARSRRLYDAARDVPADLARDPALARHLARTELFTGHPPAAYRFLGLPADPALLVAVGTAALVSGDADLAMTIVSGTAGPDADVVRAVASLHTGAVAPGARLLIATTPTDGTVETVVLAAHGLSWIGAHRRASLLLRPVVDELRAAGALGLLPFALVELALCEIRAGDPRAAWATATAAVELAGLATDTFWRDRAHAALAYVHAVRGDEAACRRQIASVSVGHAGTADALGLLETGLGRHGRAAAALLPAVAGQDFHRQANLVEARVLGGQAPAPVPAVVADRTRDAAELPGLAAIAWRLRGLTALDDGPAERAFLTAVDLHQVTDSPLDAGRTHLAFGRFLRRAGHRIRARQQLRLAVAAFTRVGAALLVARAHEELVAAGGPASTATSAAAGVGSLTPQELQTAGAVATGATNREVAAKLFLSTKTVEFHLSNVYRKLGVRTRTELAHRFPGLAAEAPVSAFVD